MCWRRYDKRNQLRGSGRELGPEFEKRLEKESFCSGKIEVLAGTAQKRAHAMRTRVFDEVCLFAC